MHSPGTGSFLQIPVKEQGQEEEGRLIYLDWQNGYRQVKSV